MVCLDESNVVCSPTIVTFSILGKNIPAAAVTASSSSVALWNQPCLKDGSGILLFGGFES